jgi:hypothetical protein
LRQWRGRESEAEVKRKNGWADSDVLLDLRQPWNGGLTGCVHWDRGSRIGRGTSPAVFLRASYDVTVNFEAKKQRSGPPSVGSAKQFAAPNCKVGDWAASMATICVLIPLTS